MLDIIYKNGFQKNPKIKQQLKKLHDDLAKSDIDDKNQPNTLIRMSHWLLAYVADRNKWLNVGRKVFEYVRKKSVFSKTT